MSSDPRWLIRAHIEMGVTEEEGSETNPQIMGYYKACGAEWVTDDVTPWCGAFVGAIFKAEGFVLPSEPLRARAWLAYGTALAEPQPGCIVVLSRGSDPASGHVGFFRQWSEDRSKIYLVGGNQGDCVSIAAFSVDRVLGYRWPPNPAEAAKPVDPMKAEAKSLGQAGATVAATGAVASQLPTVPVEYLSWLGAWKDAFSQLTDFWMFVAQHWMIAGGAAVAWTGYRLWSWRKDELKSGTVWGG